jgi:hypothetical protein
VAGLQVGAVFSLALGALGVRRQGGRRVPGEHDSQERPLDKPLARRVPLSSGARRDEPGKRGATRETAQRPIPPGPTPNGPQRSASTSTPRRWSRWRSHGRHQTRSRPGPGLLVGIVARSREQVPPRSWRARDPSQPRQGRGRCRHHPARDTERHEAWNHHHRGTLSASRKPTHMVGALGTARLESPRQTGRDAEGCRPPDASGAPCKHHPASLARPNTQCTVTDRRFGETPRPWPSTTTPSVTRALQRRRLWLLGARVGPKSSGRSANANG